MVDGGFLVWVLVFDDSALQDGFGWITVAALVSTVVFFGLLAVMALAVQLGQSDQMSLAIAFFAVLVGAGTIVHILLSSLSLPSFPG